MKKDRIVKLTIAVILISTMVIGGSIAYFRAETSSNNTMSSTSLKIALMEKGEVKEMSQNILLENVAPGATIPKELYVKNLEDSGSYVRVTLTKYWEDLNGQKLPALNSQYIELVTQNPSQWIIQDDDENHEVVYMYYKQPLQTNEETKEFLNQVKISSDGSQLDNQYAHLNVNVNIEVDAIQQYAAQQAILSEWGLDVVIDDQGIIQEVEK